MEMVGEENGEEENRLRRTDVCMCLCARECAKHARACLRDLPGLLPAPYPEYLWSFSLNSFPPPPSSASVGLLIM